MSQPPQFELERHPFFWITQVIGARDRALAAALKGADLRVPEWRVLASLFARKRLSMKELADLSSIDRTTLTRTVDRLQQTGRLTRLADAKDARVTRLALTAAAAARGDGHAELDAGENEDQPRARRRRRRRRRSLRRRQPCCESRFPT